MFFIKDVLVDGSEYRKHAQCVEKMSIRLFHFDSLMFLIEFNNK